MIQPDSLGNFVWYLLLRGAPPYRESVQLPVISVAITITLLSETNPDESERSAVK